MFYFIFRNIKTKLVKSPQETLGWIRESAVRLIIIHYEREVVNLFTKTVLNEINNMMSTVNDQLSE